MARKRTIVLTRPAPPPASRPGAASVGVLPIGTFRQTLAALTPFNISPDGSGPAGMGEVPGMAVLFGPGFILELPFDGDDRAEVRQIMVTVTDEDFAWPVLSRMCKAHGWKMMDPDSGRTFG